jgi:sulfatase maturation enzyme AslB (radical SAM superfamily)
MKNDIGVLTFYITNVCNLNCDHCSYLNNYPVKGHQLWKDNEESCRQWADRTNPSIIFLLGGEPMLNPDFIKWVIGIADLWPEAELKINTNGTCFDRWPELYDVLLKYKGRVNISISGHNEYNKQKELDIVEKFLKKNLSHVVGPTKIFQSWIWKKTYEDIRDPSWPDVNSLNDYYQLPDHIKKEIETVYNVKIDDCMAYEEPVEDYEVFVDENNIKVAWARWDEFGTSAIKFDPIDQKMKLHDSDPVKAVSVCHGGHCAHIKDGKLYKCQVMGILPDMFDQKFPFDISEEDKNLILSYEPALPTWDDEKLNKFTKGLENQDPIPQCKFCPEKRPAIKIYATAKKPKVAKLKI